MTTRHHSHATRVVPTLLLLGAMGSLAQAADPVITAVGNSVGTATSVDFAVDWTDDVGGWDPTFSKTTAQGTGGDFRVFTVAPANFSTVVDPSGTAQTGVTLVALTAANVVSSSAHRTVFHVALGSDVKLYAQIPAGTAYLLGATPTTFPSAAIPSASTAQLIYTVVPATPTTSFNSILTPSDNAATTLRSPTLAVSVNIDDDETAAVVGTDDRNTRFSSSDVFQVVVYEGSTPVGSTSFTKTGGAPVVGITNRQTVGVTLSTALPVGNHTLVAKVVDPVGNAAASPSTIHLLVWDAPTLQVNGDDATGSTFTVDRANNIILSGTKFNGDATNGSAVTLKIDGTTITPDSVTDATKFQFTVPSLASGASHTVQLTQTHTGSGLTAHPKLISTYTIDNSAVDSTPPDAPVISSPQAGATVVVKKPLVTGITEPNCTVQLRYATTAAPTSFTSITSETSDANGAFSFVTADWSSQLVANTDYIIQVRSTDAAGNVGAWSDVGFNVSVPVNAVKVALASTAGITTGADGNKYSSTATAAFNINLTDLAGGAITGGTLAGLTAADIVVTNGTFTSTLATAGSLTITVTATAAGPVTINIPAGGFSHNNGSDGAINNEALSAVYTYTKDAAAPTFTTSVLSYGASTTTIGTTYKIVVAANEPLSAKDKTKITQTLVGTGGTIGTLDAGTFSTDKKTVTFLATGAVASTGTTPVPGLSVAFTAGLLTDMAGNTSAAVSVPVTRTWDVASLDISTITSTATATGKVSPIPFVFTFTKAATGFDLSDLDITNGVAASLTGTGTTYTLNVVPGEGPTPVKVAIKSGTVVTDAVGTNATITGTTPGKHNLTRIYDSTPPRVLSLTSTTAAPTTTDDKPTNRTSIPCSLVFSEAVTGLTAAAFQVENGSISGLSGAGSAYTFNVDVAAPTTDTKKVRVVLMASKVQDVVATTNSSVAVLVRNFDGTAPTLNFQAPSLPIAGGLGTTTSKGTFVIDINGGATSDVLATKFDATKLNVLGGSIDSITTSTATVNSTLRITQITVNVTMPRAAGNVVTLTAAPGVITDLAGNKNASTSSSLTIPGAG